MGERSSSLSRQESEAEPGTEWVFPELLKSLASWKGQGSGFGDLGSSLAHNCHSVCLPHSSYVHKRAGRWVRRQVCTWVDKMGGGWEKDEWVDG